jgi:thiosulfate/3-mercaptopyruvate sulfurtransferase
MLFAVLLASTSAYPDKTGEQAHQSLIVDSGWLAGYLGAPGIMVVDARSPEEYAQGHIAGAISLPFADTYHARLKNRIASQAEIQELLGSHGMQQDDHVIIYGGAVYLDPARVFWALELYGHANVSLLNGGYPAWKQANLSTDTDVVVPAPDNYSAVIRPGLMATKLQVMLAIDNPDIALVDTRQTVEFQGIKSQASRSGHIPTAINIPSDLNLEVRQGVYYFKPGTALEKIYKDMDGYSKIIIYCNSGREFSTSYLALRLLGKQVSVYDGGWKEWGNNPELPVVVPAQ